MIQLHISLCCSALFLGEDSSVSRFWSAGTILKGKLKEDFWGARQELLGFCIELEKIQTRVALGETGESKQSYNLHLPTSHALKGDIVDTLLISANNST